MARPSSVEQMPPEILEKLQTLLRDPRVNQLEATAKINDVLASLGHETVSKSAVNRYAQKMAQVGKRLQESRDMAQMWIGKLGSAPQGEVGKLLNETIRTLAFETTMKMAEDEEEPVSPKVLAQLSLAVQRLEASATVNLKRDEEIRKQANEEAAEQVGQAAKELGLTEEGAKAIKNRILGIP
ncbi:DUF3486 family protein [Hydrogenovibrio sp. 3SP14C1]|uniref:DUF3486 family protein n=1 Tax=Hydrogenovibrio sp. 3SP14C1 TaxID=3038774 RepID=UPI002415D791|nr:DUF3486 family protein [Hydrogenovibrio sp. 3SP14C1]MDG4811671.1 DUF3486 family protein [Hydrogenovibrio sp. 3SP14C1]